MTFWEFFGRLWREWRGNKRTKEKRNFSFNWENNRTNRKLFHEQLSFWCFSSDFKSTVKEKQKCTEIYCQNEWVITKKKEKRESHMQKFSRKLRVRENESKKEKLIERKNLFGKIFGRSQSAQTLHNRNNGLKRTFFFLSLLDINPLAAN